MLSVSGGLSRCDQLWEERIPRMAGQSPRQFAFPAAGAGEPVRAAGAWCFSPPRVPSLLPTDRRSSPGTPTLTDDDDDNNHVVLFEPSQLRLPARRRSRAGTDGRTGRRAPPRLTRRAAGPNRGAGVPGVGCFCTLRCLLESQRAGADAVTGQRSPCVYCHPPSSRTGTDQQDLGKTA